MAHGTTTAGAALMQAIGISHAQATGRANTSNSAPPEASMQLHPNSSTQSSLQFFALARAPTPTEDARARLAELMEDWKQPTCRWRDLLAAHNNTQQPGGHSIKKALAVCIRESGLQGWFLELHNSNHLHDGLGVRAWTDTAFMDYSEGRVVQGRVRGVVAPRTSPLRSSHQTRVLDAPESYRQSILQGQMHAWHNMDQIRTRATT